MLGATARCLSEGGFSKRPDVSCGLNDMRMLVLGISSHGICETA